MSRRVRGPLDGPLLPYGAGFRAVLAGQGYSADSIGRHLRLMVHLSRWLAGQHLSASDLTGGCARRFLRFRQAEGHAHPASMVGMAPLLDYLRSAGAVPAAEPQAAGPAGALIVRYQRYLLQERGLSPRSSVPHYIDVASRFVAHVRAATRGGLEAVDAAAVAGFVLSVSQRRSVGEAKAVATRLRSFLRFLELEGLTRPGLLAAVPSVAGWQLTGLPQAIRAADVGRLLGSCDRRRPAGLRDFAILTVLARGDLTGAQPVGGKQHQDGVIPPADRSAAVNRSKDLADFLPGACVFKHLFSGCRRRSTASQTRQANRRSPRRRLPGEPASAPRLAVRHACATHQGCLRVLWLPV
jgi:integrase/recombinase XerD